LAAEAKKRFSIETELVEGHGGVYKVWVDGRLLWDKKAMGGFPDESDLLRMIGSAA